MSDDHKLIPVDIKRVDEQWNTVELIDGSILKTKLVYTEIFAVYNDKNEQMKNPDGTLQYVIHHATIHRVSTPIGNVQQSSTRN